MSQPPPENPTLQQALQNSLVQVDQLVRACDESKEFRRPQIYVVEKLRRQAAAVQCHLEATPAGERLSAILNSARYMIGAISVAQKELGTAGNFGCESAEGQAIRGVYNSLPPMVTAVQEAGGVP